jgi:hypothetical protein
MIMESWGAPRPGQQSLTCAGEFRQSLLAPVTRRQVPAARRWRIGIHRHRSQQIARFASDDEDALTLWAALAGSSGSGHRTRDLLRRLVSSGAIEEDDARDAYCLLQTDDLHNLGGPPW